MSKPYGIIRDTHNHAWSAFSKLNEQGINNRLQITLDETYRAAETVKKAGGDTLYHAGDMFHVRGSVAPSVLNPTIETYRRIVQDLEMRVVVIPGNHDLEGNDSNFLSNASSALRGVGVEIAAEAWFDDVLMLPWHSSIASLKASLEKSAKMYPGVDVIRLGGFAHLLIAFPNTA